MEPTLVVILLFGLGILVLVAEIFIPSYGLLCIAGLGFLAYAVYRAYIDISSTAGHALVAATIILVPTLALIAVKTFHRTPWGKKLAPPNPIAEAKDFAPQHEALKQYVGLSGKAITPLRPVGTCMFNDDRVNCVAESGMIDNDTEIEAVGIRGREVEVRSSRKTT